MLAQTHNRIHHNYYKAAKGHYITHINTSRGITHHTLQRSNQCTTQLTRIPSMEPMGLKLCAMLMLAKPQRANRLVTSMNGSRYFFSRTFIINNLRIKEFFTSPDGEWSAVWLHYSFCRTVPHPPPHKPDNHRHQHRASSRLIPYPCKHQYSSVHSPES